MRHGTGSPPADRLRFTPASLVRAVAIVAGATALAGVVSRTGRVVGWLLVAGIGAGLLHPIADRLARRIPRFVAIVLTLLVTVGTVAGVTYLSYDDLLTQARRLERAATDAAAEIEASERFGEAARTFELEDRVRSFVDELPDRLRGGEPADALRSAATRGVAFFITGMLTLFLLVHGSRLLQGALRQVHDGARRRRVESVLRGAHALAWRYLMLTLARAAAAGSFAFVVSRVADVPGATVLGVWVGVWAIVPMIGVLAGSTAVWLLTAAVDLGSVPGVMLAFVVYQLLEVLLVQRRIERASVRVGPALTLLAGMAGLEVYGVGGLGVAVVLAVVGVAVLRQLAPTEAHDLEQAIEELAPEAT